MIPVKQLISAAKTLSSTYLPPQVGNNLNWGFPQTDISAHQRQVDSTLRCVINQNKTKQNKKDTKHALQLFNFTCPTLSTSSACLSINNCRRLNTRKALIEYSKKPEQQDLPSEEESTRFVLNSSVSGTLKWQRTSQLKTSKQTDCERFPSKPSHGQLSVQITGTGGRLSLCSEYNLVTFQLFFAAPSIFLGIYRNYIWQNAVIISHHHHHRLLVMD